MIFDNYFYILSNVIYFQNFLTSMAQRTAQIVSRQSGMIVPTASSYVQNFSRKKVEASSSFSPNHWKTLAKVDLLACYALLKQNHPAYIDRQEKHESFHLWLEPGLHQALGLAEKVSSFEGYRAALAFYIAGFKDFHLTVHTPFLRQPSIRWPGFLVFYRGGKFFVSSTFFQRFFYRAPPNQAEVLSINGKPPSSFISSNLFPYARGEKKNESSWVQLTPLLLFEDKNPWHEKIEAITYRFRNKTWTHSVHFFDIDTRKALSLIEKASYGKPPSFAIRELRNGCVWISIPSFNSEKKEVRHHLEKIVACLPSFRTKKQIVFDLRGNGGGNSVWVVEILKALYGEEYLSTIPHVKNSCSYTDRRLSEKVFLLRQNQEARDLEGFDDSGLEKRDENIQKADQKGKKLIREETDIQFFSKIKKEGVSMPRPVLGRVYLLTDGRCSSSALLFADALLSIPGTTHVGMATSGDTLFTEPMKHELPSRLSSFLIPTKVRRNWERDINEAYIPKPEHTFPEDIGNSKILEKKILDRGS